MRGPADDSYGIEVAKLAGVPEKVIARSKEILHQMQEEQTTARLPGNTEERFEEDNGQLTLLPAEQNELVNRLRRIDVNTLTPIEAMQTLYELVKSVGD